MKELEALKDLDNIMNEVLQHSTINNVDNWGWKQSYELLKKALTPPTSEEVVKALNKEFPNSDNKFKNGKFYANGKLVIHGYDVGNDITINHPMPPHLITLIGRFYQRVKDNDK